jgi:methionyl-tRNA formyltransferase
VLSYNMAALRVIFMGTAELSCVCLQTLLNSTALEVISVVTQPDRPKGRDLKLQASPVKRLASEANLPILQPLRARDEQFIQQMRALEPDLIAVAAFGQILPQNLLDLPRFGCLNVHTSLLPKYRGAAPIQWAILNDESETGVTIMKMDAGLDTGDILAQQETPIPTDDTSETLHERLAHLGADLLVSTIPKYVGGELKARPQPLQGVSYARKIKKDDGQINWAAPARTNWNKVRGLIPWPGAFTFLADGPRQRLLKIWQADVVDIAGEPGEVLQAGKGGIVIACCDQALRIFALQREGSRRVNAQEFLAGHPLPVGTRLSGLESRF